MKVMLIAGHGDGDSGALGNGLREADMTRKLVAAIKPYLSKYCDVVVYDTNKNAYAEVQKGTFVIPSGVDYVWEVHLNAGGGKGVEIFTSSYETSTNVESVILSKLIKFFFNRGLKKANFSVITTCNLMGVSAALCEYGFIDTASDMEILQNNLAAIAKATAEGIAEGFKLEESNTTPEKPSVTPPTTTKKLHVYKINEVKEANGIWQLRSNYLVPVDFTWTDNGIPLDDVDFTDVNGKKLSNQVWDGTQKYFTFRVGSVTAKTNLTKGSGGYYWIKFNSDNGDGDLWLSCDNLNDLYYRAYDNGQ